VKLLIPPGRRTELLTRSPVAPQLVVSLSLLRILEHFVRLLNFLEALLGVRFFAHIRMKLAGELAIGPPDFIRGRLPLDTEYLVIVLVFHTVEFYLVNEQVT
jgi:hypothetical protein